MKIQLNITEFIFQYSSHKPLILNCVDKIIKLCLTYVWYFFHNSKYRCCDTYVWFISIESELWRKSFGRVGNIVIEYCEATLTPVTLVFIQYCQWYTTPTPTRGRNTNDTCAECTPVVYQLERFFTYANRVFVVSLSYKIP